LWEIIEVGNGNVVERNPRIAENARAATLEQDHGVDEIRRLHGSAGFLANPSSELDLPLRKAGINRGASPRNGISQCAIKKAPGMSHIHDGFLTIHGMTAKSRNPKLASPRANDRSVYG